MEMTDKAKTAVAQRLKELGENTSDGRLTPAIIVEDAMKKSSPLHTCGAFTWDKSKAAYSFWIVEARALMRRFSVPYKDEQCTVAIPYYVHDPDAEPQAQAYIPVTKLQEDKALGRRFLAQELARVSSHLARAERFAVMLGMPNAVKPVVRSLHKLEQSIAETAAAQ